MHILIVLLKLFKLIRQCYRKFKFGLVGQARRVIKVIGVIMELVVCFFLAFSGKQERKAKIGSTGDM
jgi:hypothetical protein